MVAIRRGVVLAALLVAAPAGAEPVHSVPPDPTAATAAPIASSEGRRLAIDTPRQMYATPAAEVSPIIYLERCKNSCEIHKGTNDARTNTSSIPNVTSTVKEFFNSDGETGVPADAEWAAIVRCMKEVYSPYNVTVTDEKPGNGLSYHEAIIAGKPGDIGLASNILGVAPLASDCSAIDNVISFTFANQHTQPLSDDRVLNICWTAAQESAHAFGLDHEFEYLNEFLSSRSACNDPMTYRQDCGGQKFFRNESATCGETGTRACKCGASQNSHLKLLSVFGAGTPITGAPTIMLTTPAQSGGLLGKGVIAQAGAQRGVARVKLFFNGFEWGEVPGARFTGVGQPNPSGYALVVPDELPNSVVDVKVVAYDDLGAATESQVVTVTKGAPCATAGACATGQKCEAGKCFWDPPSGELGDVCSYKQFCKTGLCTGTASEQICTQACLPGSADSCPSGLSCVASSATSGVCFFEDSGGCCSVDRGGSAGWIQGGLAALALGLVIRRRRGRC